MFRVRQPGDTQKGSSMVKSWADKQASRTYPIKKEVGELRKNRGNAGAEKALHEYRKMRTFSKASGTWGKKNAK